MNKKFILALNLLLTTLVSTTILGASAPYTLHINDKPVDLTGTTLYQKNNHTMIPLRKVADSLGFKVDWNPQTKSIDLDNGEIKTSLTLNRDSYYKASSKAIGLTQPQSLGVAPTALDGVTYIPAELFNLLYSGPTAVTVKGTEVSIKSPTQSTLN